jgi:RND family efflux transporter MFP subunit
MRHGFGCGRLVRRRFMGGLFVLFALVLAGCGNGSRATDNKSQAKGELPSLKAETLVVSEKTWPSIVRTQGSLMADEVATVGTKVAGRISEVHVDLGDVVRANDPLATLDQEECRLQVTQAEAQLAQAAAAVGLQPGDPVEKLDRKNAPPVRQEKAVWDEAIENLKRARVLFSRSAISESEVQKVEAAESVAAARYASSLNSVDEKIAQVGVRTAELSLARQRLADTVIRARIDGLVRERQVAPGSYVSVGHAIATIVRSNPLRFRGTMPERHAQQLAVGQSVTLQIESIEQPRTVKITRISPALDEASRALLFEALVDNTDGTLRTGLFAEGEVVLDPEARSVVVPVSAVNEFAGAEKVWKVVDGTAQEQEVRTGLRRPEGVEIVSGLNPGDRILVHADEGRIARIEPVNHEPLQHAEQSAAEPVSPAESLPSKVPQVEPLSE